jgi:hypothetical protein
MAIIKVQRLGRDYDVLVDERDLADLSLFHWYISKNGYAWRSVTLPDGRTGSLAMHRQLTGCKPGDGLKVDHLNHDTLDNRRRNLSPGSHSDNLQNSAGHRDAKTSSERGVSYDNTYQHWNANHMYRGQKWSGAFATEEEATQAVCERRMSILGFAVTRVPVSASGGPRLEQPREEDAA